MSRFNCVCFQAGIKLYITMLYILFITFDDISDFVSKSKLSIDKRNQHKTLTLICSAAATGTCFNAIYKMAIRAKIETS